MSATVTQGLSAVTEVLNSDPLHLDASFATAALLPVPINRATGHAYASFRASLSDASDIDYFRFQTPAGSTGSALSALVWGLQGQLDPRVRVFDAQHYLLPADVLVNDGASYALQVPNAVPLATYYVEVLESLASTKTAGNYFLGIDFAPHAEAWHEMARGALSAAQPTAVSYLTVNQRSQFFHFILSASAAGSGTGSVQMTIADATGKVVFTMTAGTTEAVSSNVSLTPGRCTVRFTTSGSALANRLRGDGSRTKPQWLLKVLCQSPNDGCS